MKVTAVSKAKCNDGLDIDLVLEAMVEVDLGGVLNAEPEQLEELNARYGLEMQPDTVPELLERFGLRLGEPL